MNQASANTRHNVVLFMEDAPLRLVVGYGNLSRALVAQVITTQSAMRVATRGSADDDDGYLRTAKMGCIPI
jgi:hypothetical protein